MQGPSENVKGPRVKGKAKYNHEGYEGTRSTVVNFGVRFALRPLTFALYESAFDGDGADAPHEGVFEGFAVEAGVGEHGSELGGCSKSF